MTYTCPQLGTSDHLESDCSLSPSVSSLPPYSPSSPLQASTLSQLSSKGIMRNMEMCSVKLSVTNSPSLLLPRSRLPLLPLPPSLLSPPIIVLRYFVGSSLRSPPAPPPIFFLAALRTLQRVSLGDDVCDAAHRHGHRRLPLRVYKPAGLQPQLGPRQR